MNAFKSDKTLTVIGLLVLAASLSLGICQGMKVCQASNESQVKINLKVSVPGAKEVKVAGSFNNWQPRCCMEKQKNSDEWTIELSLTPGVYEYVLLVDGKRWVPENSARQLNDGLGGTNGVLYVNRQAPKRQGANDV